MFKEYSIFQFNLNNDSLIERYSYDSISTTKELKDYIIKFFYLEFEQNLKEKDLNQIGFKTLIEINKTISNNNLIDFINLKHIVSIIYIVQYNTMFFLVKN